MSITLLIGLQSGGIVQPLWAAPLRSAVEVAQASGKRSATVVIVNPAAGSDVTGNGSTVSPFKTITHALQIAQPNTVIRLLAGTYSTATGERFPLRLKSGVRVQGDPVTRGQAVILNGGGSYAGRGGTPSLSVPLNVTVVGASQATLEGITISNPNAQGYGLWVEATQPTISDNTFTGNGKAAIAIAGSATPLILNNFFYNNGSNGVLVFDTARPRIQDNMFEQTGVALQSDQNSAPLILGNRIIRNQQGIVVQGQARPVLRNNSVESNQQDGLVLMAQAQPDLGTIASPGGNWFRNNGRFDLNSQDANIPVISVGNEILKQSGALAATPPLSPSQPSPSQPSPSPLPAVGDKQKLIQTSTPLAASPTSRSPVNAATPTPSLALLSTTPTVQTRRSAPRTATPSLSLLAVPAAAPTVTLQPQPKLPPLSPVPASRPLLSDPVLPPESGVATPLLSASSFPAPAFSVPDRLPSREQSGSLPVRLTRPPGAPAAIAPKVRPPKIVPAPLRLPSETTPVIIPVPPPETATPSASTPRLVRQPLADSPRTPVLSLDLATPNTTTAVTQPSINTNLRPLPRSARSLPVPRPTAAIAPTNPNLLPVPDPNIPIGNVGSSPQPSIYRSNGDGTSSTPSSRAIAMGYRYRVYVDRLEAAQEEVLRRLVPDAFITRSQGRSILQVGLFRDRAAAEQLIQTLSQQGVLAMTEPLR